MGGYGLHKKCDIYESFFHCQTCRCSWCLQEVGEISYRVCVCALNGSLEYCTSSILCIRSRDSEDKTETLIAFVLEEYILRFVREVHSTWRCICCLLDALLMYNVLRH